MRAIVLTNIAVWSLLLLIFTTVKLPGNSLFTEALQNSGHGLAMCAAAFFGIWSIKRKRKVSALGWKLFVIVAVALLLLSVLIEVVQSFNGRDASFSDLVMDAAGIAAGIILSLIVFVNFRLGVKAFMLICAFALLMFVMRMPTYFFVEKLLAPKLPVLANFDTFAPLARIDGSGSKFTVGDYQDVWPVSTANSLKVTYSPARYWSRVSIAELPKDWSNFSYLSLDVFNAQDTDVKLNIRVDYKTPIKSNRTYMVARPIIPPGYSTIEVSHEELAREYYTDEPDFTQIKSMILFMRRPVDDVTLYFDNLRLR